MNAGFSAATADQRRPTNFIVGFDNGNEGDMAQNTQWDTSFGGSVRQRPALSQFDYASGWGAQAQSETGGLTQDSAARVATLQAKLSQRLGPEYLAQRPGPGGGKKFTYVEGWLLIDLANEVFGFNGWSTQINKLDVDYIDVSQDGTRFSVGASCIIRITLRDGAFHEDFGYGTAENLKQKGAAIEHAKKGAVTDATKRAIRKFGKLLGNCTYDQAYTQQALKVPKPLPKFDPTDLHRRPELRAMQQPKPQPNATETRPPSSNASASTSALPKTAPTSAAAVGANSMGPPHQSAQNPDAEAAALRQQRSAAARRDYMQRQAAKEAEAAAKAAEQDLDEGADLFDEDLSNVMAHYDDTDVADSEAASMALELELEMKATRQFDEEAAKLEDKQIDTRRSLSPVKQAKAEVLQPRRAGSVGRFLSPPPQTGPLSPIKNGVSTLSASSRTSIGAKPDMSGLRNGHRSSLGSAGGVETARAREVGHATGQAVNHSFMSSNAVRGAVKRPNDATTEGRPASMVRHT